MVVINLISSGVLIVINRHSRNGFSLHTSHAERYYKSLGL